MSQRVALAQALPRSHLSLVSQLEIEGGVGWLDIHGFVHAGQLRALIPGDARAWLVLVSHGLIAGEHGEIMLTDKGREAAKKYQDGLVREA